MAPTKSGPSLASERLSNACLHTVRHVSLFVTDWPLDKTGGSQKWSPDRTPLAVRNVRLNASAPSHALKSVQSTKTKTENKTDKTKQEKEQQRKRTKNEEEEQQQQQGNPGRTKKNTLQTEKKSLSSCLRWWL